MTSFNTIGSYIPTNTYNNTPNPTSTTPPTLVANEGATPIKTLNNNLVSMFGNALGDFLAKLLTPIGSNVLNDIGNFINGLFSQATKTPTI
jgi:hypothetical protein